MDLGCFLSFLSISKDKAIQLLFVWSRLCTYQNVTFLPPGYQVVTGAHHLSSYHKHRVSPDYFNPCDNPQQEASLVLFYRQSLRHRKPDLPRLHAAERGNMALTQTGGWPLHVSRGFAPTPQVTATSGRENSFGTEEDGGEHGAVQLQPQQFRLKRDYKVSGFHSL